MKTAGTRPRTPMPTPTRRRRSSREDAVVTSFAVPRPLHQRLMIAAARLNWTLAQVLRDTAEQWLARHEARISGKAER